MCLEPCLSKIPDLTKIYVYIDGNNVAYSQFNQFKKPLLSNIIILINYLIEKIGFSKDKIHCICDPSLKYYIDKQIDYKILIEEGVVSEAPKIADEIILSFALKHEFCFVISNDKFREYIKELPSKQWLEDRRINFLIIDEEICLSPNISYERFQKSEVLSLNRMSPTSEITTLDILDKIEKSEGELNLF